MIHRRRKLLSTAVLSLAACAAIATSFAKTPAVQAQSAPPSNGAPTAVTLPVIAGWYDGKPTLYISTETSDRAVAQMTHITYAPKLANAIAGGAVDDIYMVTNFNQGNVISSAPLPEGPNNHDRRYTPLWQLSLVTWTNGAKKHILRSEDAILAAQAAGNVHIQKTNIVINCPILYTPQGGTFPHARFER